MQPVAVPGGPYAAEEGAAVTLDGSGSSDPDAALGDRIVRYEWDLNNDGVFETLAVPESNSVVQVSGAELAAMGLGDGPSEHAVALENDTARSTAWWTTWRPCAKPVRTRRSRVRGCSCARSPSPIRA